MKYSLILVLALSLFAKEARSGSSTTDDDEIFIAGLIKKTIDDLENKLGTLRPDEFKTKIIEVLETEDTKERLKRLVQNARERPWMEAHGIEGIVPMVSSPLAYEIKRRIGVMPRASAELDTNAAFKERYNSAGQFIQEALNLHFSEIENAIIDEKLKKPRDLPNPPLPE